MRYYEKNLKPSKATEERHVPANLFFFFFKKKREELLTDFRHHVLMHPMPNAPFKKRLQ